MFRSGIRVKASKWLERATGAVTSSRRRVGSFRRRVVYGQVSEEVRALLSDCVALVVEEGRSEKGTKLTAIRTNVTDLYP